MTAYPGSPAAESPAWSDQDRTRPHWDGERLVDPSANDGDRAIGVLIHLWWVLGLVSFFPLLALFPLGLWMVRQSSSGFIDDHGREAVNAQLTMLLLVVIPIFWIVLPIWLVVWVISSIRAALASTRRQHFRYPMIWRFL